MNSRDLHLCKTLVTFLGHTLGENYEIVLHDLNRKDNAVVAIANGDIRRRKTGSPLTDAALQMLASRAYLSHNYLCNYKGTTEDGMTQDEKISVISHLNRKGLFQLKGSVPYVAKRMSCSVASVYRYLNELEKHAGD